MPNFAHEQFETTMAKYLYFLENLAGEILCCGFSGVKEARSYCWLLSMDGVQDEVTEALDNADIRICKYNNLNGERTYYEV